MLVTINFKDREAASCVDINELDYMIVDGNLAIYQDNKFIGYFSSIIGMDEEIFLDFVKNYLLEKHIEIK